VDWDFILKAFMDVGYVEQVDEFSAFETDETLWSVGLGAELAISRNVNVRMDWGIALEDVEDAAGNLDAEAGDNRFHFVFTLVF
jgi:hemolysin activation/secretion protein